MRVAPCRGRDRLGHVGGDELRAGYTDDRATCRRDAHIISANDDACPWYDKCGLTFSKGCSTCPDGYANDGCTCRRDVHIFAKSSYGRGVGSPMSCAPGRQQIGALCYGACDPGWDAAGVECLGATICQDVPDPTPQPALSRFCFKVTRSSWVDPCDVAVAERGRHRDGDLVLGGDDGVQQHALAEEGGGHFVGIDRW